MNTPLRQKELQEKKARLISLLKEMGSVVVAFSGGVDSTLLLKMALEALGRDKVLAVTAQSPTYPSSEVKRALSLAKLLGAWHLLIDSEETEIEEFMSNPPQRCYYCKMDLFSKLAQIAREEGMAFVCDGANSDDASDFRPGRKAGQELGVRSPLMEAGLKKQDIRDLARDSGLPNWDKPAYACLSSRFPYGQAISIEKLQQVERAEEFLRGLGLKQLRVRHHGQVARLEVAEEEMSRFSDRNFRVKVSQGLKKLGFTYVSLDLEGYRMGSMNEALEADEMQSVFQAGSGHEPGDSELG